MPHIRKNLQRSITAPMIYHIHHFLRTRGQHRIILTTVENAHRRIRKCVAAPCHSAAADRCKCRKVPGVAAAHLIRTEAAHGIARKGNTVTVYGKILDYRLNEIHQLLGKVIPHLAVGALKA